MLHLNSETLPLRDVIQVWSAPRGATRLPCDLAASVRDVAMLLWFKDAERMPIYTNIVTMRGGSQVILHLTVQQTCRLYEPASPVND
ncbi:unnamed protein product [Plutella xylostella]|uniref:(diamondback moth) hypothetical protein n=1 Tax=Plutella xylostella TaxID=51655 RepID=A0A8S4DUZ8_PLUXY|nr:unnamed protein product [Plutella xylostella]